MESGGIDRFQTFDLNNTPPFADVHHRQGTANSASPCNGRVRSFVRCTTGCSIKRRSPSPSSTLEEPPTKRAALCQPSDATANGYVADAVVSDGGINNDADAALVKPSPSETNLHYVPNRPLSETITCYARAKEALNSQPVESSKINISVSSPEAATWPPLHPVLHGSSSEPIPSDYLPEADSTTPSKTLLFPSPPGSDQDSVGADARRLRRMKERMKQMNQWIQKVTDDDEEYMINQNPIIDTNSKKMSEETKLNQEAVVVEENGENLILHFNCPCGKGFEIFLSGRKCYYRLM